MRFALVVAVAVVLASSATATGPFTPKTLAGTWSGSWTNETFGSSGPVTFVATPLANSRLRLSVDFGGGVFGCSSVSVIGAFFGSTFTGKVKIKLAGGQAAISSISLTRD